MPILIPQLSLSTGQALWVIGQGMAPSSVTREQANYLRALGVPKLKRGSQGRGNRIRHSYYEAVELAIAFYLLHQGYKPAWVAEALIANRGILGPLYGRALGDQPERGLTAEWVRSRGQIIPILGDEHLLRLHDRAGDQPGKFELLGPKETAKLEDMFILRERFPGGEARRLVPLTRIALQLVAWAREVPDIRPGPK